MLQRVPYPFVLAGCGARSGKVGGIRKRQLRIYFWLPAVSELTFEKEQGHPVMRAAFAFGGRREQEPDCFLERFSEKWGPAKRSGRE